MKELLKAGKQSPYYKPIKKALKTMDREIENYLKAEEALLQTTAIHLYKSGGKRLRPIFVLLGGHFGTYNEERLLPMAMAMEITHMATLVHDDVVDNAMLRRNRPTVKALWGNKVSIFTGNFLLAKAMKLVSSYEDETVNTRLSGIALEMCKGELSQMSGAFDLHTDIDTYLLRIKQKTALLLSASCELGAHISGASEEVTSKLRSFGENLGMAFQVTDDILDYMPDGGQFGKILGGDIRQGIPTLPLLYTLKHSDKAAKIESLFGKKDKTQEEVRFILEDVTKNGGIEYAKTMSEKYTDSAKADLESLPQGDTRDTFLALADYILKRKY